MIPNHAQVNLQNLKSFDQKDEISNPLIFLFYLCFLLRPL